ncbi:hypothetical protein AWB71_01383 [Caballeronia peredens]|nr:hypothetical protein AWB71_01383 [Caballeronia peredens]
MKMVWGGSAADPVAVTTQGTRRSVAHRPGSQARASTW